jgi:nitrogen regulatory protein P-II 1
MVKIEAVIQPSKLDAVMSSLQDLEVGEISIFEVQNQGGTSAHKRFYRGAEYCAATPMIVLGMVVSSLRAEEIVEAISRAARTGFAWDDGTILIYEVADAIKIRSGARVEFSHS